MQQTLRDLCVDWLTSLSVWSVVAPKGRGLTPKAVAKSMIYRTIGYDRPDRPKLGERLNERMAEEAYARLEERSALIVEQLHMVRQAVDEAIELAKTLKAHATITSLAEKALGLVGSWNSEGVAVTDDQLGAAMSSHVHNVVSADRVFDRGAFAGFEAFYDDSWTVRGEPNMADFPYSAGLLGHDAKPPLLTSADESTWGGLDRSVYVRYRKAAMDPAVDGDADDVATAEIQRACGRWGLSGETSLVVLKSLRVGIEMTRQDSQSWAGPKDRRFDHAWREVPGPIVPSPVRSEDELYREWGETGVKPYAYDGNDVASACEPWVNRDLARQAQAAYAWFIAKEPLGSSLLLRGETQRAQQHIMRRAWMECFRFDRRGMALSAADASRVVNTAIQFGVFSGETHGRPLADRYRDAELRRQATGWPDGADPTDGSETEDGSFDLALEWLMENREVAQRLYGGDPEAIEAYRAASEGQGWCDVEILLKHAGCGVRRGAEYVEN